MRTAFIIAAAFFFGQVAVERSFHWKNTVKRDRPMMSGEDTVEHRQQVEVERFDSTITITTWGPMSRGPKVWYTKEESISIDASGWKELMPVIQEAIAQEK